MRPPAMARTAIVTGANKGIGLEVARLLAERGSATTVVLTSRDEGRAARAVDLLGRSHPSITFLSRPLDLNDPASIASFADWATDPTGPLSGRIDALVNNAGRAFKGDTWGAEEARLTLQCNYSGTAALTRTLLPCMPATPASRIVNVGSRAGQLRIIQSPDLRARWEAAVAAGPPAIESLVDDFVASIAAGTTADAGWPRSMYGVSKLAEAAWTRWLAAGIDVSGGGGPAVALVCPGACATDMSSGRGRPAAEGADTVAWLASAEEADGVAVHGGFWADRARVEF
jgi:carbonyl reductase 1